MQRMPEPGSFQEIEQPFHDAERRVPTKCSQHVAKVRASNLKELEPVPPIRLAWATESGLSILPRRRDVFVRGAFEIVQSFHVSLRLLTIRRHHRHTLCSSETFADERFG